MPREMTSVDLQKGKRAWLERSSCFLLGALAVQCRIGKIGSSARLYPGLPLASPSAQSAAGHPPRPGGMLLPRIRACQEILVFSDKPLLILLVTSGPTVFPDYRWRSGRERRGR